MRHCERMNARRCHAAVACLLVATAMTAAALLALPNSAYAQAKTRIAVTAFENKVKTPLPDASWKMGIKC